jgi:hypothetical protein
MLALGLVAAHFVASPCYALSGEKAGEVQKYLNERKEPVVAPRLVAPKAERFAIPRAPTVARPPLRPVVPGVQFFESPDLGSSRALRALDNAIQQEILRENRLP